MKNCYFQRQCILDLEVRVQDKSKLETFIDWFDSEVETDPVLLFDLKHLVEVLGNFNCKIWPANFDWHFVVETELFSALTEPCGHLEVEEVYCVMIDYLLFIFLFEPYRVRHSSCSFDDLIDNIVTDCAIFKTDNIDHAIWLYGVFYWKLFVKFLWGLEVLGLFGLTDTDIGQSISHDDSRVRGIDTFGWDRDAICWPSLSKTQVPGS